MTDRESPTGSEGAGSADTSVNQWKTIFRDIDEQVRRDAARVVGAEEDADWSTIGRGTDDAVRRSIVKAAGLPEDAKWDAVGTHLEKTLRASVAQTVGTNPSADWAAIGQTVEAKIRGVLNDLFSKKEAKDEVTEDLVDPWKQS